MNTFWSKAIKFNYLCNKSIFTMLIMRKSILSIIFCCSLLCQIYSHENFKFHTVSYKGGLSYDGITDIKQDGRGFMWIMLGGNLFRFDGYSYKSYKEDLYHGSENQAIFFNNLDVDIYGNLYISTSNGLYQYEENSDSFKRIINSTVDRVFIDNNNRFWINSNNKIHYLSKNGEKITPGFTGNEKTLNRRVFCESENRPFFFSVYGKIYEFDPSNETIVDWANFESEFEGAVLVDATIVGESIWVLTSKFKLMKIDLNTKIITYSYKHPYYQGINLRCLYVSEDNLAWVGTINGLYILNPVKEDIYLHQNIKNNSFSIPNNSIWTINEDNHQNIWIGTYMGSLVYVNKHEEMSFETHKISSEGLNMVPVSRLSEIGDKIWVSTEGGGINIFDLKSANFTSLPVNNNQNSLSSENTKNSVADNKGNVWISTFRGGLNCYNTKTKAFTYFNTKTTSNNSLYSDNIRKIILEPDSGLWIIYQEHTTTISFFSFNDYSFEHFTIDEENEEYMKYDYIYDGYRDNKNQLWLISSYRLYCLNIHTKEFSKYPITNSSNPASTLCLDNDETVWIGTFGNELIRFDQSDKSMHSFSNILQSNIAEIYSINFSENQLGEQTLWMGTNDGLYKYNTETNNSVVFKEADGTQGDVYYPLSTLKDSSDLLYFGGTEGFTIIDPYKVYFNLAKPNTILSDFYIDNKSVLNNDFDLSEIRFSNDPLEIELNHKQQNFGFKFSSDNYLNANKNMFRYRLKNYDNRWIITDATNRTVFYSKIPAGRYLFEVQTANNDGIWGDVSSVIITRKQTPWLRLPAIIIYALIFGVLLYYFISMYKARRKLELQIYMDQLESDKNEEIHKNQLQFFTNISHDLKTPLSLIMITINKMREEGMREYYYRILNNNAERLLRLLNDILDFRKTQNNRMKINVSNANLGEFIHSISGDFIEYAQQKDINFQIITNDEELSDLPFDEKVMEKIIMNLLINSFKYTRKGDSISIIAGKKEFKSKYTNSHSISYEDYSAKNSFYIVVSDTGIGISKESIAKVFDRFYQVESNNQNNHMGSGIGLALVKNLVMLHKGSLTIYSERGVGSDFVIELSSDIKSYLPEEVEVLNSELVENKTEIEANIDSIYPDIGYKLPLSEYLPSNSDKIKDKTILIAEDNEDLRNIIKSSLEEKYEVVCFDNGKHAYDWLKENEVDLILSDIMMPVMDGITFCKKIKNNVETSHIPFILLTAKSGVDSMIEGTESGADLYFEKPVDLTLLKTSISNIFKKQDVLREYYAKNYFAEVSSISPNKQDNQFLIDVTDIIDERIDQSELDVNTIATEMMMSRSKLYSKIKALTGKSVVEFILSYRLRKAAKLLVESEMNIQQAMYAVGIESRSYFTKAFKKEFDMTPSQFQTKNKNNGESLPN